ncbi:asparagine synthase (glutamine-hydrolyzing) [Hyphobacterium sp. CCMP332]|nr:asparagine synthase (glutamine-hydrolyzing) [Hyphobacterium sp. CCMP332]
MCGILGYHSKNGTLDIEEFKQSLHKLFHRGPDASGIYNSKNLHLGHRRLSIIDVKDGTQPMISEDGRYVLIFNGEIYNYKEIARKLKLNNLKTKSDTEVLLEALKIDGTKSLNYLRGMFSFAFYDKAQDSIIIARDHFGIKPLHYFHENESFAFSSEINALKSLGNTNLTLDLNALDLYLKLNYIPAPFTIYNEIRKLKPGHYLTYNLNTNSLKEHQYYNFEFNPDFNTKFEDLSEAFEDELRDSVIHHTYSDVPYGAFLSGGIDSTIITKYMSEYLGKGVKSFTIEFEDEYSELGYAKKASETFGLDHYQFQVKAESVGIIDSIIDHSGEPFGDSSVLPTYYLSKMASNEVKMVLSGDGADEFLGGYNSYFNWLQKLNNQNKNFSSHAHLLISRIKNRSKDLQRTYENWLKLTPGLNNVIRNRLWKNCLKISPKKNANYLKSIFDSGNQLSDLQQVQNMDIKLLLQGNMLPKVDIASMMNSLEVRTPFVDVKLANFISKLPPEFYFEYQNNGFKGKLPLQNILLKTFSKDFVERPKHGFTVPLTKWIKEDKEFIEILSHYFKSENSSLLKFFNQSGLEDIYNSNKKNHIWSLIILGKWLDKNES